MRKYTIVYSDGRMIGSHYNAITKFERIETKNLSKYIKGRFDIWFIFEGWPRLEGESEGEHTA